MASDLVVYMLRLPNGTPAYVGKGYLCRAYSKKRSARVVAVIAEHGPLTVDFLRRGMTQGEAFDMELDLIRLYGRRGYEEGGILSNVALGGEIGLEA